MQIIVLIISISFIFDVWTFFRSQTVDRYWGPLASDGNSHHSVLCAMMLVGSGVTFTRCTLHSGASRQSKQHSSLVLPSRCSRNLQQDELGRAVTLNWLFWLNQLCLEGLAFRHSADMWYIDNKINMWQRSMTVNRCIYICFISVSVHGSSFYFKSAFLMHLLFMRRDWITIWSLGQNEVGKNKLEKQIKGGIMSLWIHDLYSVNDLHTNCQENDWV